MEELFYYLKQLHPDIEIDILCYNTDQSPAVELYRGMTIYRVPCYQIIPSRFNLPKIIPLLRKLKNLRKNGYTHVQTHLRFFDTTWWSWYYAKEIGAVSLFTEHVATHPTHQFFLVSFVAWLVDVFLAPLVLARYDILMTTNQAAKTFLKKNIGIKQSIEIIYGGIATKLFTPHRKSQRSLPKTTVEIETNTTIITFVGRLIWTKGVTYFYEAIKTLHPQLPKEIIFVIAGSGELSDWLTQKIHQDQLEKRIFTTGSLDSQEVNDLLQQSDIVVHPSHHNEGFPNVLLEAGACGCFVIATDIGGSTEIIQDSVNGLIIPTKNTHAIMNAINFSLQHIPERKRMAQALRERITLNYDWEIIAKVYFSLLTKHT
jgi:glycosyltransferase involved in cell wall biosynthesis